MKMKKGTVAVLLGLMALGLLSSRGALAEPAVCVEALLAELSLSRILGEDLPPIEPRDGDSVRYLTWALHHMSGCDAEPLSSWQGFMDLSLAQPLADVAVVVSPDMAPSVREDALGYSQLLTRARIPHTFLPLSKATEERIYSFRALIVVGEGNPGSLKTNAIDAFGQKGGGILLSGGCSKKTKKRDKVHSRGGFCLVRVHENDAFEIPVGGVRLSQTDASRVLVRAVGKKEEFPVVVSPEKGVLLSGVPWGLANYQGFGKRGQPYPYERNAKAEEAAMDLLKRILGGPPSLEIRVGEGVLVKAYKAGDRYAVHLLNISGLRLAHGERVPSKLPDPAFPPVKGHSVFDFHFPNLSHAWVSSPDYKGERMAWLEWENENTYRVVMPPESLERYSIVYVCEG